MEFGVGLSASASLLSAGLEAQRLHQRVAGDADGCGSATAQLDVWHVTGGQQSIQCLAAALQQRADLGGGHKRLFV